MQEGDRVWTPAGEGTVARIRRDGRVWVDLDGGGQVLTSKARSKERPVARLEPLDRPPTTTASLVPVPKGVTIRAPWYLAWVRTLDCACCGERAPSEASHHPERGHGSTGAKASDLRTIPLCSGCHRAYHARGALPGHDPDSTRALVEATIERLHDRRLRDLDRAEW